MASRSKLTKAVVRRVSGLPASGTVAVKVKGTNTDFTGPIYAADTGGTTLPNPFPFTDGLIEAYFDSNVRVKLVVTPDNSTPQSFDNVDVPLPGDYVPPNPTAANIGAARSTVGDGLPAFTGRLAGDLHYDSTAGREYVLTGTGGASITDTFTRADATSLGTSETGGVTYAASASWDIQSNSAYNTGAGGNGTFFGGVHASGNVSASIDFSFPGGFGNFGGDLDLEVKATGNGGTTGYRARFDYNGSDTRLRIYRGAVEVAASAAVNVPGGDAGVVRTMTITVVNEVVTATCTGFATVTYTDGSPLAPATSYFNIVHLNVASTSRVDNLTVAALGTLAWTLVADSQRVTTTRSPGEPTTTGRTLGDLHYDETSKTLKVLSDANAAAITDNFGGAAAALNGRSTETGGAVWTVSGNSISTNGSALNVASVSNQGVFGFALGTAGGDQDVQATYQGAGSGGSNYIHHVSLKADSVGGTSYYRATLDSGNLTITKVSGGTTTLFPATNVGISTTSNDATPHLIRMRFVAATKTITVWYDNVQVANVVDTGTALTGTFFFFTIGGQSSPNTLVDNFSASSAGGSRWVDTDQAVASHLHAVYSISTVGAGLPALASRLAGDQHFDTTALREYTATGVAGTRVDVAPPVRTDSPIIGILVGAGKQYAYQDFTGQGTSATLRLNQNIGESGTGVPYIYGTFNRNAGGSIANITIGQGSNAASASVNLGASSLFPVGMRMQMSLTYDQTTGATVLTFGAPGTSVTLTHTFAPSTANSYASFRNGGSGSVTHVAYAGGLGTLAWTPTSESVGHTHALPTRSTTAAVSTVGSGLPVFGGRLAGDLHQDSANGRQYTLNGLAGAEFYDDFSGAVGSTPTVDDTGKPYVYANTGTATVNAAGRLAITGGKSVLVNTGVATNYVITVDCYGSTYDAVFAAFQGNGTDFNGYGVSFYRDISTRYLQVVKNGGFLLNNGAADSGGSTKYFFDVTIAAGDAAQLEVTMAVLADRVRLTARVRNLTTGGAWSTPIIVLDDVQGTRITTGTHWGVFLLSNSSSLAIDNLSGINPGTLEWVRSEPQYLSAIIPGAATITASAIKPGLRVPEPTRARNLVARADVAPVGSDYVVTIERWNNGTFANNVGVVTIPAGQTVASTVGLSVSLAQGDILKANVSSVGSTTPASDVLISADCWA